MSLSPADRKQARANRRSAEARRRQDAKRREAEEQEKRAERIAPQIQRVPVMAPDGTVLRGARLEPDGLTFRVSNPVRHLARRGQQRAEAGGLPAVTQAHVAAAERLLIAWHEGAEGVGMGASNYGERTSGTPQSGMIANAVLATLDRQIAAKEEVRRVIVHLGGLWPVINAVVIRGIDASAWAAAVRMDRKVALGYLSAALDRLAEFYAPKQRTSPIRSATVVGWHTNA